MFSGVPLHATIKGNPSTTSTAPVLRRRQFEPLATSYARRRNSVSDTLLHHFRYRLTISRYCRIITHRMAPGKWTGSSEREGLTELSPNHANLFRTRLTAYCFTCPISSLTTWRACGCPPLLVSRKKLLSASLRITYGGFSFWQFLARWESNHISARLSD